MNEHLEHLEEVAQAAAEAYGHVWRELPMYSKDFWRETVRHCNRSGVTTAFENCAAIAISEWYDKPEPVKVAPPVKEEQPAVSVEKKTTRKKKGED